MSLHMPVAKQRGSTYGKTAEKQDLLHSAPLSSGSSKTASGVKQKHLKKKAKILEIFCHYSSSLFLHISNFRMP
jgi:hypothetical protein